MMTRRGALLVVATLPLRAFKSHLGKASVSAITDEIGRTQADAIDFAHQYGLQWVELRRVPETKKEFALLTDPELKQKASELAANKLKVSLLHSSLPDVQQAVRAANILGADKILVHEGVAPSADTGKVRLLQPVPSTTNWFDWTAEPGAYSSLPKSRMLYVHFRETPQKALLEAMQKGGYESQIGIETGISDGTFIEKAHELMKDMLHMVGQL
jgi:hypothetical protein